MNTPRKSIQNERDVVAFLKPNLKTFELDPLVIAELFLTLQFRLYHNLCLKARAVPCNRLEHSRA